jgi:hypothetical protein
LLFIPCIINEHIDPCIISDNMSLFIPCIYSDHSYRSRPAMSESNTIENVHEPSPIIFYFRSYETIGKWIHPKLCPSTATTAVK